MLTGGLFCLCFLYPFRRLLHILHIHPGRDAAGIPFLHAVVDVGVFCGDFWAALAQGFLHDAQILRLLIEVRTAAVTEEVACIAGLLEPRLGERLVDNVADADA